MGSTISTFVDNIPIVWVVKKIIGSDSESNSISQKNSLFQGNHKKPPPKHSGSKCFFKGAKQNNGKLVQGIETFPFHRPNMVYQYMANQARSQWDNSGQYYPDGGTLY